MVSFLYDLQPLKHSNILLGHPVVQNEKKKAFPSHLTGYDPDNFDKLIKRKYWEVFQEREKDDLELELTETRQKRSRLAVSTVCAFKGY